jgi:hypothetical protein
MNDVGRLIKTSRVMTTYDRDSFWASLKQMYLTQFLIFGHVNNDDEAVGCTRGNFDLMKIFLWHDCLLLCEASCLAGVLTFRDGVKYFGSWGPYSMILKLEF